MVFDKVNHLSSSHLNILLFSRLFDQNCIVRFQRGNSYIIVVLELICLRRMVCFTTFGAGAMVATPHPCHCLSIFRGRARPMWVAQWFHVSPIPMIYDSGAFVLVPARKKSLRMALCFFAKHFSLLEPADGTCRRRAYTTLCVTHRFIWFHLMCKLSAQGV